MKQELDNKMFKNKSGDGTETGYFYTHTKYIEIFKITFKIVCFTQTHTTFIFWNLQQQIILKN